MIPNIRNILQDWNANKLEKYEDTELCKIIKKFSSDKKDSTIRNGHNYTNLYFHIFNTIKNKKLNIFELGIGTNDPNIPSTMGKEGVPGASLFAWAEFFSNSYIFGADIDKKILFNKDRIKTFYCDQTDFNSIKNLWNNDDFKDIKMDIIIEDGIHEYEANITFLENSIHKLNNSGLYFAEDLPVYAPEKLFLLKENFIKKYNLSIFEVIQMNKSPFLIIQKNEN